MAATTGFAIGPIPTDMVTMGQPIGHVRSIGAINTIIVPFSTVMSNSYSTNGDTLTLPTSPPLISGYKLQSVILTSHKVGANRYNWDGSTATPKITAWSAFNTEVTAATDLSAVTMTGHLVFVS